MPGSHRLRRRLAHVPWRVEVGLADLEVDHVTTLALELARASEHAEGRLGTETVEAFGEA